MSNKSLTDIDNENLAIRDAFLKWVSKWFKEWLERKKSRIVKEEDIIINVEEVMKEWLIQTLCTSFWPYPMLSSWVMSYQRCVYFLNKELWRAPTVREVQQQSKLTLEQIKMAADRFKK